MSGTQFNLLPNSRVAALEIQAQQELLLNKALKITLACAALFIVSFLYANVLQKAQLNSTNSDIKAKSSQLQQVAGLPTVLTVQNQLQAAATLNQSKHISSNIFGYLSKLTPSSANVSDVQLDFTANTIKIQGTADSATTVNAFIDGLKYAKYTAGTANGNAFSQIIEDSFTINSGSANFSLSGSFDPNLFANNLTDANGNAVKPSLNVSASTSRSSTDPGSFFSQSGGQ